MIIASASDYSERERAWQFHKLNFKKWIKKSKNKIVSFGKWILKSEFGKKNFKKLKLIYKGEFQKMDFQKESFEKWVLKSEKVNFKKSKIQ